jgi:hypothetical protein
MNEVLTDSLHALAVRHRVAFRDCIGALDIDGELQRTLSQIQDQIRALMQDYAPHDMVKEFFDCEDLVSDIDGMVIAMGSGFVFTIPI